MYSLPSSQISIRTQAHKPGRATDAATNIDFCLSFSVVTGALGGMGRSCLLSRGEGRRIALPHMHNITVYTQVVKNESPRTLEAQYATVYLSHDQAATCDVVRYRANQCH